MKALLAIGWLMVAPGLILGPPDEAIEYDGSEGELDVRTPWLPDPAIRIDGRLDEVEWGRAALLHSFTQNDPLEGAPATQRTEVLVFVSGSAIYFGVRAHDTRPDQIRATLAERDNITSSDDYIRLVLDTFNDQRRAYVFAVNPFGVQQDGIWSEGGRRRFGPPVDYNPNFLWESEGRLESWGYSVEVRIPLKSLRFPKLPTQAWGFNVTRRIQRSGYEESWAPISSDEANQLGRSGRLAQLRDLDAGLFMEVNPVLTGKRLGAYDDGVGGLDREDPQADFGFNITYGLTSNLTLDGTFSPDFSQVEADAGQIAVNERFALYFPEKRPFFLEGTEIFSLPKQVVYTRSIVDPLVGAKLTGKVGSFNIGYLGAVDQLGSSLSESDAIVNLMRVRRDVGRSSTVGLVYTDRTRSADVFNRVGGLDARLVSSRHTLTLMAAASQTGTGAGERVRGGLVSARIDRTGRELSFSAELEDVHPDFRAESGFIRRLGDTQLEARLRRNWHGAAGTLLERWGPSLEVRGFWDRDDFWSGRGWKEARIELGTSFSFRNNMTFSFSGSMSSFDEGEEKYQGLFLRDDAGQLEAFYPDQDVFQGLLGLQAFLRVNTWDRVRGRVTLEWEETPLFDGALRVPVEAADAWTADLSLNLYPTRSLRTEVGVRHTSLFRQRDGGLYSRATIPRIRAQYQFTRSLFFRTVVEYGSQERRVILDPVFGRALESCGGGECSGSTGRDVHDIHLEALVTYEPSPGTVMYLGYLREMDDSGAFAFRDVRPQADGLFAKVSYRFRF
jgi:hypothetical protein